MSEIARIPPQDWIDDFSGDSWSSLCSIRDRRSRSAKTSRSLLITFRSDTAIS